MLVDVNQRNVANITRTNCSRVKFLRGIGNGKERWKAKDMRTCLLIWQMRVRSKMNSDNGREEVVDRDSVDSSRKWQYYSVSGCDGRPAGRGRRTPPPSLLLLATTTTHNVTTTTTTRVVRANHVLNVLDVVRHHTPTRCLWRYVTLIKFNVFHLYVVVSHS